MLFGKVEGREWEGGQAEHLKRTIVEWDNLVGRACVVRLSLVGRRRHCVHVYDCREALLFLLALDIERFPLTHTPRVHPPPLPVPPPPSRCSAWV